MGEPERVILHVDMDAFYAAIEVLDNPELRGKPVIVGGTPEGHGVVSTASYEARRHGVQSAMPAATAVRLCPHGIFLPPRPRRYAAVSSKVMGVLSDYTPLLEPISIDEAFLDITGSPDLAGAPGRAAREIKRRIREATSGLTASVGVAPNKYLAKVASDLRKPDGLVVVRGARAREFLAPLPVEKIWGVGPRTAASLHAAGYTTIGDLQPIPLALLRSSFGDELGGHLHRLANGIDDRPVVTGGVPRSISSERTLARFIPSSDRERAECLLLALSEDVAGRLRSEGGCGRTVTIKVRDDRFVTRTRSMSVPTPVQLTEEIYAMACRLFRERIDLRGRGIRLLGVAVTQLSFDTHHQPDLFDSERRARALRLAETLDSIRRRLGGRAIVRGRLLAPGAQALEGGE